MMFVWLVYICSFMRLNNKNIYMYWMVTLILLFIFSTSVNAQKDAKIKTLIDEANVLMDSYPDSAFQLYKAAEELAELSSNEYYTGDIAYGIGRYYLVMTDYGKSAEEINKALLYYEQQGETGHLASTYSLQGILLERIGDEESSHLVQVKACQLAKDAGDISTYASMLTNLILDYLNPEDIDSAYYFLKELESIEGNIREGGLYYYNQNWGKYYLIKKDHEKSIVYFNKALDVANEYDMVDSKATIYMEISNSYILDNQFDEAQSMAVRSYKISEESSLIYEKSEALYQLVYIAELLNNYQDAFTYQKELTVLEKEIFNVEKVKKAKEMEGQLNLVQKEKIIAEQELSIRAEQQEADRVKSQNNYLYLVIGIVSLLVFFTLWIYFKTRKLNTSINLQKDIIQEKGEAIEEAYNNIHDSLEYSKYIQRAMLPSNEFFNSKFSDHFIYFQPKDIVSGDFYWGQEQDGCVYVAAVDCTGHGVPGAMVSIIGYNGLNRCLKELNLKQPSKILNNLSDFVEESLFNEEKEMKDGMDMALCSFDLKNNVVNYAGANNSIYVVSNGELKEYKSNKRPVGKFPSKNEFKEEKIEVNKGDAVYLFSDGYADQFGGAKGKKMKYKAFREILTSFAMEPMEVQMELVKKRFEDWKGDLEQIDDVCIIGIRI